MNMPTSTVTPVASAPGLTASWLTDALGLRVETVATEIVGTGQMGSTYRLRLSGDPALPGTVLAKLPSEDAGTRMLMAGAYLNEIRFYNELASGVDIKVPRTYYAAIGEEGTFTLLMQDLAPAQVGDQILGCSPTQALGAVVNLAGLHGPSWCDPALLEVDGMLPSGPEMGELLEVTYPPAIELFTGMLGDRISSEDNATLAAITPLMPTWMASRGEQFAWLHMDYRLDNLLFEPDGTGVYAVDWQGLSIGHPLRDVAFFLSTGLSVADRRDHEEEIVRAYHARLAAYATPANGLADYTWERCWEDYRFGMLQNTFITVFGCAYSSRTERGDRMFLAMIERGCAAIRDLDTLALVEEASR